MHSVTDPLVCHLPLELLLKIFSQVSFADVWYFGTCSRACQRSLQTLMLHMYHIHLGDRDHDAFSYLLHSAIAYITRHGHVQSTDGMTLEIHQAALQFVSNRLAVEIYDRTPKYQWENILESLLDKTLGTMVDHVLIDQPIDTLLQPCIGDIWTFAKDARRNHPSSRNLTTRTSQLISHFLGILQPTLIALFDTGPLTMIHHRLLLSHLDRNLQMLTKQYRHSAVTSPFPDLSVSLSLRVFIRFIGSLVQTDLITATDLQTLTQQQLTDFFVSKLAPTDTRTYQLNSILTAETYYNWRFSTDEVDFNTAILLDLLHAVTCRQYARWDSRKEVNAFAVMLSNVLSTKRQSVRVTVPASSQSFVFNL